MKVLGWGLIAFGTTGLYILRRVYLFLLRVLDDPDTWKLLDGK